MATVVDTAQYQPPTRSVAHALQYIHSESFPRRSREALRVPRSVLCWVSVPRRTLFSSRRQRSSTLQWIRDIFVQSWMQRAFIHSMKWKFLQYNIEPLHMDTKFKYISFEPTCTGAMPSGKEANARDPIPTQEPSNGKLSDEVNGAWAANKAPLSLIGSVRASNVFVP